MHSVVKYTSRAVLLCALLGPGAASADDPVIANLGSQPVKGSDVREFLDGLNPQQREQAANDPKMILQLVRSAIGRKLVLEDAEKQGWDKKPDVAAQIARAREEVVLTSYLRSVGLPPTTYPSEDDVKAAYEANREHFMTPRQYHIAQIFVAEPPNAKKDAIDALERKARDLAKKAKAKGADFAGLARTSSDDPVSAQKGGDLGWLPDSQILPEILAAVRPMGDKGVTDAIHAAGGWHILSVLGVKPAELRPLDQVHDQIVALLRESKIAQNDQAYVEKLLADRHLTINETAAEAWFQQRP
jgi:parvulin-like peptidyl-prolyl isomerase